MEHGPIRNITIQGKTDRHDPLDRLSVGDRQGTG
jgi:hypothetical protein